jgi:cell wall-associated NlpC family hydrolase
MFRLSVPTIASVLLLTAVCAGGAQVAHAQRGASTDAGVAGTTNTAATTDATALPRGLSEFERPKAFTAFSASLAALRDTLVTRAQETLGVKYKLGGTSPSIGFDCSALVRHVLSSIDIMVPRTSREQARAGREIPKDRSAMQPGDLLTFGSRGRVSHVGIYVGDGRFIHASTSQRRVVETSLDNPHSSLVRQWQGVRRVVDDSLVASRFSQLIGAVHTLR